MHVLPGWQSRFRIGRIVVRLEKANCWSFFFFVGAPVLDENTQPKVHVRCSDVNAVCEARKMVRPSSLQKQLLKILRVSFNCKSSSSALNSGQFPKCFRFLVVQSEDRSNSKTSHVRFLARRFFFCCLAIPLM